MKRNILLSGIMYIGEKKWRAYFFGTCLLIQP